MSEFRLYKNLYQNLTVSGSIVLFCVVATAMVIYPFFGKIRHMIVENQSLTDDTKALTKKLEILSLYDETQLEKNLALVLSAVPGEKQYPSLFATVEGVAARSGVTVDGISVGGGPVATASGVKQSSLEKQLGSRMVPMSVTVVGDLVSLEQFISLVPEVRRLMRINTFSINFTKSSQPIIVSLAMNVFYEPYETSLGGTGAVITELSQEEQEVIETLSQFPKVFDLTLPAQTEEQARKKDPFAH